MNHALRRDLRTSILPALAVFLIGVVAVVVVLWNVGSMVGSTGTPRMAPVDTANAPEGWDSLEPKITAPSPSESLPIGSRPATAVPEAAPVIPTIGVNPTPDLRSRMLGVPVQGVHREDLRESFTDARGGARVHEAMDILAARHTPVLAVEDGKIARLFFSKAGGITVYQFDPTERYVYYYAHLQKYADNLKEDDSVRRGQVIGYVGTTGNAPPDTPHLHFAIFRLTDQKRWWEGTPIDPYDVLRQ